MEGVFGELDTKFTSNEQLDAIIGAEQAFLFVTQHYFKKAYKELEPHLSPELLERMRSVREDIPSEVEAALDISFEGLGPSFPLEISTGPLLSLRCVHAARSEPWAAVDVLAIRPNIVQAAMDDLYRELSAEWVGKGIRGGAEMGGEPEEEEEDEVETPDSDSSATVNIDLAEFDSPARRVVEANKTEKDWHRRCLNVLNELVVTERNYVAKLTFLHVRFREAVTKAGVPVETTGVMLSTLTSLHLFHSRHFLPAMESALAAWEKEEKVALTVLSLAPYLRMYSDYSTTYSAAMETLRRLVKENSRLAAAVKELEADPECDKLPLVSHFLCPVQRLTRYHLLLEQYLKPLPESHPEVALTRSAIIAVKAAVDHANSQLREMEAYAEVRRVEESLGLKGLVTPSRRLVREGDLRRVAKRGGKGLVRRIFLFNDILLVGKKRFLLRGYRLRELYELYDAVVSRNNDGGPGFRLQSGKDVDIFRAKDEAEAAAWFADISRLIVQLRARMQSFVSSPPSCIAPT